MYNITLLKIRKKNAWLSIQFCMFLFYKLSSHIQWEINSKHIFHFRAGATWINKDTDHIVRHFIRIDQEQIVIIVESFSVFSHNSSYGWLSLTVKNFVDSC